jgi:hypothetical protein
MANISIKKDFRDGEKLFAQQLNNNFEAIEAGVNGGNKIIWSDDNGAEMKSFRGTTEEINNRPIIDGQTLYNVETGETALDVGDERISTGAGNVVAIKGEEPQNEATKIWIEDNMLNNIGTEVVNSLDGNEENMAPSVAAINKLNRYSTEEQKIGTWIDGKPLYRKVIDCGALPDTNTKNVSTNLPNTRIRKIEGTAINASNNYVLPLPYHDVINANDSVTILCDNNSNIMLITGKSRVDFNAYVTLEYTKTTDEGGIINEI